MGPTGLDETWLWYDTEGRGDELVKTKKCEPAEVLWPGYKCVNGIAETSKVNFYFSKTRNSYRNCSDWLALLQLRLTYYDWLKAPSSRYHFDNPY